MSKIAAVTAEDLIYNEDPVSPTIHNPRTGHIFVINKVGERVLQLCDGRCMDEIVSAVEAEFAGTTHAQVCADINDFLQEAVVAGVIRWQQEQLS